MIGLDNILDQIGADAKAEAEEQLSAAKTQAEALLTKAGEEAKKRAENVMKAGEARADDIRRRAESAAQLERRNAMLRFKQELIRETIEETKQSLESAPDEEYFRLLTELAGRYAREGKAQLRMNQRDLNRMPVDFPQKLKAAAPQTDIDVSPEPVRIGSGFLLIYEGIDVNCTLDAVFEDCADEMRDGLSGILFPAG